LHAQIADASEHACDWAVQTLCRRRGDTLHLLRIVPSFPHHDDFGGLVGLDALGMASPAPLPPTEVFKSAAERLMHDRFEPRLQVCCLESASLQAGVLNSAGCISPRPAM
jgi:hypothetical protein